MTETDAPPSRPPASRPGGATPASPSPTLARSAIPHAGQPVYPRTTSPRPPVNHTKDLESHPLSAWNHFRECRSRLPAEGLREVGVDAGAIIARKHTAPSPSL